MLRINGDAPKASDSGAGHSHANASLHAERTANEELRSAWNRPGGRYSCVMSERSVEVVRCFNEPHESENVIPWIQAALERVGPDPDAATVLSVWADDPGWRYGHPEIEWDVSGVGAVGAAARGARDVAVWWADWVETWRSYIYRMVEYRDLGEWILTPVDVRAEGREGISVDMRIFQIWRVQGGQIRAMRAFLSEREALEAAGSSI